VLTLSYGTGKGRPPTCGVFLIYADEDYVGPFCKSSRRSNNVDGGGTALLSSSAAAAADPPLLDENPDWMQNRRASHDCVMGCLEVLRSACVPGGDGVLYIVRNSD
jgi:hypothetical protein